MAVSMLDDVFELLTEPDFQKPGSGLMSFPAYVYVYPPDQEYAFREALPQLAERLQRANVGQHPLIANVYDAFQTYLSNQTLGNRSLLDRMVEAEADDPDKVNRQLKRHARSAEFTAYLAERFADFVNEDDDQARTYVFVHGWGSIHPYLRPSTFLDQMEPHLRGYKLILFYPGTYVNGAFRLFGRLESDEVYRASCLNERIEGDALSA
jgi:hypothetical protein